MLAAAVLGFFMITLDAVVVNVALPSVRGEFGGGITGLQWVVGGYTLMYAALLLSAGALADRAGARRAFGTGLWVFLAASAACGLAPSLSALVAARFVQGAAAALMMPSSMALLGQAYQDPARRARAVAVWAMGASVAATSGPVLGGVLTVVSWRLIFFINLPAGAIALALLARTGGLGAHSVIEAVGTQESMMQAIRSTRPGGHVGFVGVSHGVELPGQELFFSHVHLHGGPAPVRRFLPDLIDLIWKRAIDPGKVFDLELPLDQAAEAYRAMDERRAIKVLLRP